MPRSRSPKIPRGKVDISVDRFPDRPGLICLTLADEFGARIVAGLTPDFVVRLINALAVAVEDERREPTR